MPYKCGMYRLIEKTEIAQGVYSFAVLCSDVANIAKAGQFVHIKVDGFTLRRPISICDIDKNNGTIRIVFEIRGNGTAKLAEMSVGDEIDLIAPLGNGFGLPDKADSDKRLIFVGGGIGVPPLLCAAKNYSKNATVIIGFQNKDKVILSDDFKKQNNNVIVCTDDGSLGYCGFVTEPLKEEISKSDVCAVYACGPSQMLKTVADICDMNNMKCEVSLEQRMGCGVGACAVCTCIIQRDNEQHFLRVCKDGPVFDSREVLL